MFVSLLIGVLLHVASLTTIQSSICHSYPTAPVLQTPADGLITTKQTLLVSGTVDGGDTVTVQENGQAVAETTGDSNGAFGVTISLEPGTDQIVVTAANACAATAASPVSVDYNPPAIPAPPTTALLPQAPNGPSIATLGPAQTVRTHQTAQAGDLILTLFSPKQLTINSSSTYVIGNTNIPANLRIVNNGAQISQFETNGAGYFIALVGLQKGPNKIQVIALSGAQSVMIPVSITRVSSPAQQTRRPIPLYIWEAILLLILLTLLAVEAVEKRKKAL